MDTAALSLIDRIDTALDTAGALVAGIGVEQLAQPSLCPGWDIGFELNHLVGGLRIFAAELTGTDPGGDHHDDWLGADHRAAFATAAELDRAAWSRPGALDTTIRLGFGEVPGPMAALIHLTEIVVHGIDLAVLAGQQHVIDEEQAEHLLTVMRSMDFDAFRRPGMFCPERPVPADAAPHRRLLGFLGREFS
ncbi:TIGR03086 family metal-binding protein [Nocardia concava]|uniref:TIGR03086 family metal-binding protein n=1 Tax=Nocardia concava TaxID=257281 RepID=UPI000319F499|nr:TIGR03086 family metal-binding protein [Nocardia concava]